MWKEFLKQVGFKSGLKEWWGLWMNRMVNQFAFN